MVVHLFEVFIGEVVLVVSIVFLEDCCDFFLAFAAEGLRVHSFHELDEADTSGLLGIELGHDLVGGLPVGIEAVLREEQLDIVGQQHSHPRRIVSIEDLLEVNNVLI